MNKGHAETVEFIEAFLPGAEELAGSCDIVIAPPFVSMSAAAGLLAESVVALSSQNVSEQDEGAFTGEVSTSMLNEVGVLYVILGHSERRSIYGESDAFINAKVVKAFAQEDREIERFQTRNSELRQSRMVAVKMRSYFLPYTNSLTN